MNKLLVVACLAAVVSPQAVARNTAPDDATAIRAGREIAVTRCISCHVVSEDQALAPVVGLNVPSFAEIANTPGKTYQSLVDSMRTARWHDDAMPAQLLPMSRLSDPERMQVTAYVLSLREKQ